MTIENSQQADTNQTGEMFPMTRIDVIAETKHTGQSGTEVPQTEATIITVNTDENETDKNKLDNKQQARRQIHGIEAGLPENESLDNDNNKDRSSTEQQNVVDMSLLQSDENTDIVARDDAKTSVNDTRL